MLPRKKSVKESRIEDYTYRIFSNDLNSQGTVFGGLIMSTLDRIALVIAERHSQTVCVTASVDSMHFLAPAGKGDNLIFQASINRAWKSSMEIGVKVTSEHAHSGEKTHILSAYFTFVALGKDKKPTKVPEVVPESAEEKRRFAEAELRREHRKRIKEEIHASRDN
ncbi:MAG: acyl-CoA thioesterase [Simkaniaceae bacterium]|nr:acyl-CoA thioesterase [Simkaniaceae bacterium]